MNNKISRFFVICLSFLLLLILVLLVNVLCSDLKKSDSVDIFNDLNIRKYNLKLDKDGNVINKTFYDNDTVKSIVITDKSGVILEEQYFSSEGIILNTTKYEYDIAQKMRKKEIYDSTNEIIYDTEYFYDSTGNQVKSIYSDIKKNIKTENLINSKNIVQNIFKENKLIYSYKDDSQIIYFYKFSQEGKLVYSYEYNKLKKSTTEKNYNEAGFVASVKVVNEKGYVTEEIEYSSGQILLRNEYKYDESGRQIQKTEFIGNTKLNKRFMYRYDRSGNRIKIDIYDAEGNKIDFF